MTKLTTEEIARRLKLMADCAPDYQARDFFEQAAAAMADTVPRSELEAVQRELAEVQAEILHTYNTFTNVGSYEIAVERMLPLHKEVADTFRLLERDRDAAERRLAALSARKGEANRIPDATNAHKEAFQNWWDAHGTSLVDYDAALMGWMAALAAREEPKP